MNKDEKLAEALNWAAAQVIPSFELPTGAIQRVRRRQMLSASLASLMALSLIVMGVALGNRAVGRGRLQPVAAEPAGLADLPGETQTSEFCNQWRSQRGAIETTSEAMERLIYSYGYCDAPSEFAGAIRDKAVWRVRFTDNLVGHQANLVARGLSPASFEMEQVKYSIRYLRRVTNAVSRDMTLLRGRGIDVTLVGGDSIVTVWVVDLTDEERSYLLERYGPVVNPVDSRELKPL